MPERAAPVVIVLHGCAGIAAEEETLLYLLTLNGFGVFMPDSFARAGREPQCDVASARAVVDPRVYHQRAEELEYGLDRVRELEWVDRERTFLLGFSEGGAVAAQYRGEGFRGVVIIGWHCAGTGVIAGLKVPRSTPVLAFVMEQDPWYPGYRGRHCGEHFGERQHSRSLTLPGDGHSVLSAADVETGARVKRELLRFLEQPVAPESAAMGGLR
jgi:dienelactone hydrolase